MKCRSSVSIIGISFVLLVFSELAFARGGSGGSVSGLKNPNSLYGLCYGDMNKNARWMTKGWCKAITDSLTDASGSCETRKRGQLGTGANDTSSPRKISCTSSALLDDVWGEAKADKLRGLGDYCSDSNALAYIKSTRDQFANFLTQMIAALTIEESDWEAHPRDSWMSAKGVMQLGVKSAQQKAYNYGCKGINGKSVYDPQKNIRCGTYISLYWLSHDGDVGSGSGLKSRGIARYFQPFRKIDSRKKTRMKKKLTKYCKAVYAESTKVPAPGAGGSGGEPGSGVSGFYTPVAPSATLEMFLANLDAGELEDFLNL